jgi:hypothetical protein
MTGAIAKARAEQLAEQQIRMALQHLVESGIEARAAAHALLQTTFRVVGDDRGFEYVESFAKKWVADEEKDRAD